MNSEWTAPEVTEMTLEEVAECARMDSAYACTGTSNGDPANDYV
jgi:hypothetical protein